MTDHVEQPWDFGTAYARLRKSAQNQDEVADLIRNAYAAYARAEESYRKALAVEIVATHDDGVAWSAAGDLARGDEHVAELRRLRDIAEGEKEAMVQLAWKRNADRKDAQRFADWSQRREFAEAYGDAREPRATQTFGARL